MSIAFEQVILGAESAGLRMSPEEFDAVEEYDETFCYELVDGVLVVTPIPLAEETGPNELLGYLLIAYKQAHPNGLCLDTTLPQQYVNTPKGRRLADRLIWTGLGRLPNRKVDVATIAVEFVSAGKRSERRDYVDKRAEYPAAGIKEYWIIDRFRRTLTIFHNRRAGVEEQVVPENQSYESAHLPGFELPLSDLLKSADEWEVAE